MSFWRLKSANLAIYQPFAAQNLELCVLKTAKLRPQNLLFKLPNLRFMNLLFALWLLFVCNVLNIVYIVGFLIFVISQMIQLQKEQMLTPLFCGFDHD